MLGIYLLMLRMIKGFVKKLWDYLSLSKKGMWLSELHCTKNLGPTVTVQ
ncbi:hypothetical protein ACFX15_020512 [Malus domestica]